VRLLRLPAEAIRDVADGRVVSVDGVEVAWPELEFELHISGSGPLAAP
jgi:hypothetical protein